MQKYRLYLNDIMECIRKIKHYTKSLNYEGFAKNELVADGVIRNLEVIGEAVKKLPLEIKKEYGLVDWKKIAGLRDILIHEYSGIDLKIVWDIVENKVPELERTIEIMLKEKK